MTKQEQMFALIEEAEHSKGTIAAFCANRGVKMKTFFYWRRNYWQRGLDLLRLFRLPSRRLLQILPFG